MKEKKKTHKLIKAKLKNDKKWEKYKQFFPSHSTRFLISTLHDIFQDDELSINDIYELELKMLVDKNHENMFVNALTVFQKSLKKHRKLNFDTFARFFFYTWQSSRFYKDEKKKINNIYTRSNYNVRNEKKREFFYEWLRNLRKIDADFNKIIIKIRKKGL